MKVLIILGNLSNGGAQRVAVNIGNELCNTDDVYFIVFSKSENEYHTKDSIHKIYLRETYEEYKTIPEIHKTIEIRKIIKKIDPDVAVGFIQGGYALYFASIGMKFPKISSIRNNPEVIWKLKGVKSYLNKFWIKHSDAIVFQTESQMRLLNVKNKNKTVIPNPFPTELIDQNEFSYRESAKRIIMVGRLTEQKDYPTAIKAINIVALLHPEIVVNIYGEGNCKAELQEMINSFNLQDRVHIRGWEPDIVKRLVESDIYVLSSVYEGLPNSLIEAMAIGLPCVSTDCKTGPSDIIDNNVDGFLVPVGDYESMSEKINLLIQMNAIERAKIGTLARNKIYNEYNISNVTKKWRDLFKRVQT